MAAGDSHALAVLNNGSIWAFGLNTFGQLGNRDNNNINVPVKVADIADFAAPPLVEEPVTEPEPIPEPEPEPTPEPAPENGLTFDDVSESDWFYESVMFIAEEGITTGTGDGKFSPDAGLTRAQFIVMLMRAYDIDPLETDADNFDDAGETWYTGYLAAAKAMAISKGVGDNMFAPNRGLTRQEMYVLMYNALNVLEDLPEVTTELTLEDLADRDDLAVWAEEGVGYLLSSGDITTGDNSKLNPQVTATRAQMAQLLYNILAEE